MSAVLEIRGVTKAFGSLVALNNISMQVEPKTVTILIGPNGSGKTTLINVVAGFYKPDSGTVRCFGQDVTGWPPHRLYRLGVARTFQIPTLFWKLTVLENLLVAGKDNPGEGFLRSLFKRSWEQAEQSLVEKAMSILETVGLSELWDRPALNLSGGQMKLLEIGRALMADAKLLLLDEPISGVNPTLAHEIFSRLLKLRDELGITFFVIEHRLDVALSYVDQVIAMAYGELVASGKPEKVIADPKVIEAYLGA